MPLRHQSKEAKRRRAAARRHVQRRRFRAVRFETLEDRRLLATVTWDGGGDGQEWLDRFNWTGDTLPGSGDDAVIDVAANPTVRHSSGSTSVRSLVSHEALVIAGGSLTVGNTSSTDAALAINSGATLRVQAGACFDSSLIVSNGFTNHGTIELTNTNNCSTTATFTVTSGTLINAATGIIAALVGTGGGSCGGRTAHRS